MVLHSAFPYLVKSLQNSLMVLLSIFLAQKLLYIPTKHAQSLTSLNNPHIGYKSSFCVDLALGIFLSTHCWFENSAQKSCRANKKGEGGGEAENWDLTIFALEILLFEFRASYSTVPFYVKPDMARFFPSKKPGLLLICKVPVRSSIAENSRKRPFNFWSCWILVSDSFINSTEPNSITSYI